MRVNGSHIVHAPKQRVWDALQDPAVLVRTIPGCQELAREGEDAYAARVYAGVASIKGTYQGTVQMTDQDPPNSYRLRATGSGGPGTIDATATVLLSEDGQHTRVDYDADAVIGGPIAGVGQRVITGVARRNAKTFFEGVDDHLAGRLSEERRAQAAAPPPAPREDGRGAGVPTTAEGAAATVYRRPAADQGAPTAAGMRSLILAALVGAAIALAGVLVGQRRRG